MDRAHSIDLERIPEGVYPIIKSFSHQDAGYLVIILAGRVTLTTAPVNHSTLDELPINPVLSVERKETNIGDLETARTVRSAVNRQEFQSAHAVYA